MSETRTANRARYLRTCRILSALSAVAALVYLKWLLFDARADNVALFVLLLAAELFNVVQAAGFWYTVSWQHWTDPVPYDPATTRETVDVFITVCGEPEDIVERTVSGAVAMRHPRKSVWVLDDGRSPAIEAIASRHGAGYFTRTDRRGAKAGNINRALARTSADFVLILDADHVPKPEFLERALGAFTAKDVAFVQTPQTYANRDRNRVAAGAHEQQALFYGPILRGKNAHGAVFSCGTNVVFRRSALEAVGGLPEGSITEDLLISLILLKAGYRSEYVSETLAVGLGPVDTEGYFTQQSRWALGGLEILLGRGRYLRGQKLGTRIQYGLSFAYWFTGWAYAAYLVLPVAYLFFGQRPVQVPNDYPSYFLPYFALTLATMAYASRFTLSFRGVWFTLASFPVHCRSLVRAVFHKRSGFAVTSKGRARRSLRPVRAHLVALAVLTASVLTAIPLRGFSPAVVNNLAFALGHMLIVSGFVRYARKPEALRDAEEPSVYEGPAPEPAEAVVMSGESA